MEGLGIKFLIAWALGAILMLVLSFTVYRKSYYYRKAQAEMSGSAQPPGQKSKLITGLMLLVMVGLLALFDLWAASARSYPFLTLFALNIILVGSLSLFDALFIDLFLLLVWRPALLQLPEGLPTREYMGRHLRRQFSAGWIFKILLAVLAAGISLLLT